MFGNRVLGTGGFGNTYLAHDTSLDRNVAIKEYFPRDYAVRTQDHSVRPRSSEASEDYAWGLQRFLDEARTLARLDHPSIVRVYNCFNAHGTAYIVMEYVEGETLDDRLKRRGRLNEAELTAILNPLVEGLQQVHGAGFLHRDITPKNILLRKDGTPVLIDFGSARQMVGARSQNMTAIVTPGYAPLEQYSTRGRQGPWTDIYGLSAVAYRCITGTVPIDATERVQGDELVPASKVGRGRYSEGLLGAVDQGLSLKAGDRPQNLKEWRGLLLKEGTREPKKKLTDNQRRQIRQKIVATGGDRNALELLAAELDYNPKVVDVWLRLYEKDWTRVARQKARGKHPSPQVVLPVSTSKQHPPTREQAESGAQYGTRVKLSESYWQSLSRRFAKNGFSLEGIALLCGLVAALVLAGLLVGEWLVGWLLLSYFAVLLLAVILGALFWISDFLRWSVQQATRLFRR